MDGRVTVKPLVCVAQVPIQCAPCYPDPIRHLFSWQPFRQEAQDLDLPCGQVPLPAPLDQSRQN